MKPKVKDDKEKNALYLACEHGHLEIVKWLIQNCDINVSAYVGFDFEEQNILHIACKYGQFAIAKWLVTVCKMDPKVKDDDGQYALYLARNSSGEKNRQLINFLIQKKNEVSPQAPIIFLS